MYLRTLAIASLPGAIMGGLWAYVTGHTWVAAAALAFVIGTILEAAAFAGETPDA